MRLLFVSNYYPPWHIGGYEELCADIASGLVQRGHEVEVLTSTRGASSEQGSGIEVWRLLETITEVDARFGSLALLRRAGQYRRRMGEIVRHTVDTVDPDAILIWGMWNLPREVAAAAEESGRPVVYYVADYWPRLQDANVLHWREVARRRGFRTLKRTIGLALDSGIVGRHSTVKLAFSRVLCVSNAVRQDLIGAGAIPEAAEVVYNGTDLRMFRSTKTSHSAVWDAGISMIIAGRITEDKGHFVALEGLAALRGWGMECRLTVMGKGSEQVLDGLRRRADALGVSELVGFRSAVPRETLPAILEEHEVLLVPSLWPDPLPRIVQEGMAVGTLVVASAVGGIPEIIRDGVSGILVPAGDGEALGAGVRRLAQDGVARERIRVAAAEMVRRCFDIGETVDCIERYVRSLIAEA